MKVGSLRNYKDDLFSLAQNKDIGINTDNSFLISGRIKLSM